MKAQILILIIFCLAGTKALTGQPLADLSANRVGDRFFIEVFQEKFSENKDKQGFVLNTYDRKRIWNYSLTLSEKEGNRYLFEVRLERFRNQSSYRVKGKQFHKYNSYKSSDSDFSSSPYDLKHIKKVLNKPFLLLVIPHEQKQGISFSADDQKLFDACEDVDFNSEILSWHMSAIFHVEQFPGIRGPILARLLASESEPYVAIKGKIDNPLTQFIRISNSSRGYSFLPSTYQNVAVNNTGEFFTQYPVEQEGYIYFFHQSSFVAYSPMVSFHLYVEPGDEITIHMDALDPESLSFSGRDAEKYQAYHEFSTKFMGTYRDRWALPDPFGKQYEVNHRGVTLSFQSIPEDSLEKKYKEMLAYLSFNRTRLGDKRYFLLRAESVYSYTRRKITEGEIPYQTYNVSKLNLSGMILSENVDYYLDSLGLRLEEVKNSHAYSKFLHIHCQSLAHQTLGLHTSASESSFFNSYPNLSYFARYIYKDFALLTLLRKMILQKQSSLQSLILKGGEVEQTRDELEELITYFKKNCRHKSYLMGLDDKELFFDKLSVGSSAPDMWLSDSLNLENLFGQKIALIFFDEMGKEYLEGFNALVDSYPDVKFVFVNTLTYLDDFLANAKGKQFQGMLFHSPGYGNNKNRPYYAKIFGISAYLIDQNGIIWSKDISNDPLRKFAINLDALSGYHPTLINEYWETYREPVKYILLTIFLMLIVWGGTYLTYVMPKRRNQRLKNERVETELLAIRAQMNPHFLFNSLTSVQNLINQSDRQQANHYLTRFSQLVRKVLNHSEQALIPLEDELKVVDLYCELEALRFKFEYKIEVDPEIDVYNTEVPSMLIQPFVENSVRHGLAMQKEGGLIEILVKAKRDAILVEIADNGIGIRKHQKELAGSVEKSGFGLRLSDERIQKINERYKTHIQLEIRDRMDEPEPGHGTRVLIHIPLES